MMTHPLKFGNVLQLSILKGDQLFLNWSEHMSSSFLKIFAIILLVFQKRIRLIDSRLLNSKRRQSRRIKGISI